MVKKKGTTPKKTPRRKHDIVRMKVTPQTGSSEVERWFHFQRSKVRSLPGVFRLHAKIVNSYQAFV